MISIVVGMAILGVRAQGLTLKDLDHLSKQYQELHLPIPPKNANLCDLGYRSNKGGRSLQDCAYLIGKSKEGWYRVLQGCEEVVVPDEPKPVSSDIKNFVSLDYPVYGVEFNQDDAGLAIAVIENTRRHREFALKILKTWEKSKANLSDNLPSIESSLARLALRRLLNLNTRTNTDQSTILKEATVLVKKYPSLNDEPTKDFIARLGMTLQSRYEGDESVEKLIDSLCDTRADGNHFESGIYSQEHDFDTLIALARIGYKAMPNLIAHFEDERLTRSAIREGYGQPFFLSVGDVCRNLAVQFLTPDIDPTFSKDVVKAWWVKASKKSETDNCLAALIYPVQYLPEAPVRFAEANHPDLLLKAFNVILSRKDHTNIYNLLSAMVRSTLDRISVTDACVRATYSTNRDQVYAGMINLHELDKAKFNTALVREFGDFPKGNKEDGWLGRESAFATLVSYSESQLVWNSLEKATRQADVDLRLELIQRASYVKSTSITKRHYLKYLSAFFNDEGFVQKETDSAKEKHYGLEHRRVRYLAICRASLEVGLPNKLTDATPRKDWDELRARVLAKIAATKN